MSDKDTSKTIAASTPSGNTVTLIVADFRVRDGKVLVRRADSDSLDAYYLYPVPEDWKKPKSVEVPASELGRLAKPVSRLAQLHAIIPTPTDWQIEAWKVGFTGGKLQARALQAACEQLVQRMIVRTDKIRRWHEDNS